MSPHRDPETGQFVAGDGTHHDWTDVHDVQWNAAMSIDAADLDGGFQAFRMSKDDALEVIDFNSRPGLDRNEHFEVIESHMTAYAGAPTTASAEGHLTWTMQFGEERNNTANQGPGFYSSAAINETVDGGLDINGPGVVDNYGSWHTLSGYAEGSFADSTNGLGGGSDHDNVDSQVNFYEIGNETGPTYDMNDELYLKGEINTDGIADHGVMVVVRGQFWGLIHDEEDC